MLNQNSEDSQTVSLKTDQLEGLRVEMETAMQRYIYMKNKLKIANENLQQAKKLYYEQELKIKSMKTDRENLNPNTSNYPHKFSSQN